MKSQEALSDPSVGKADGTPPRPPKRAIGTRTPLTLPGAINWRWWLDFVSAALGDGRQFRIRRSFQTVNSSWRVPVPDEILNLRAKSSHSLTDIPQTPCDIHVVRFLVGDLLPAVGVVFSADAFHLGGRG